MRISPNNPTPSPEEKPMLTPEKELVQVLSVSIITGDPLEIVTGKLYAFQLLPQTLPFFL